MSQLEIRFVSRAQMSVTNIPLMPQIGKIVRVSDKTPKEVSIQVLYLLSSNPADFDLF